METFETITKRYSVRAYKPNPIEDEKLLRVLYAARLAPTACNIQPFQLIVIHTAGREAELNRIYKQPWFAHAPVVICACGVPSQAWIRRDGKSYLDIDVAIAMDHLILEATNQGLGTGWIGAFDADAARQVLGIPAEVEPIAFTPLGYPADSPREKTRKPLEEIVRYEHW